MSVATQMLSPFAYLTRERKSSTKSDYMDGLVYPMAGASLSHNRIVSSLPGEFYRHLYNSPSESSHYEILSSDMKIRMGDSYIYPDLIILCDPPEIEADDILVNPTIVIEVLSPSTEAYDRGKKSQKFRTIESLKEYALVSQGSVHVEHYVRQPNNQWLLSETSGLDGSIYFPSIDCTLELGDIYRQIDIE